MFSQHPTMIPPTHRLVCSLQRKLLLSTANKAGRVAIHIRGLSVKVKQFFPTAKATFSPFICLKANVNSFRSQKIGYLVPMFNFT